MLSILVLPEYILSVVGENSLKARGNNAALVYKVSGPCFLESLVAVFGFDPSHRIKVSRKMLALSIFWLRRRRLQLPI